MKESKRFQGTPDLFLGFSLLLLLSYTTIVVADDATILTSFKDSLKTTAPSGWSGTNPCKWDGIKCDSSGQVTSISLSDKSLSGSLPPDFNQLTHIQTISLQDNHLIGPLPSFANLTLLEEIFIDNNNFTSIPPGAFSGLPALQTLSLSDNPNLDPWLFPQDLTDSPTLTTLSASGVNLMGTIPDIFDKFPSLQALRLSYNNLTGPLPNSFAKTSLQRLWLNNQVSGLSGSLEVLEKMEQLTQVWLHKNNFTGPVPDLSNSTSLFDLQLRDNSLSGVIPPSLETLSGLLNVSLANNKLQGPFPEFDKKVTVTLGTTNNFCNPKPGPCDPRVTTLLDIAGAMGYPMNLAESWTGNNPCDGWTFISCDSQGKNVTVINFSKQKFAGTISPAFAKLTALKTLLLNDNDLTGTIPESLTGLDQLQTLDVSNNNLYGKVPAFSSKVSLKTSGNPNLGKDPPPAGAPSSPGGGSGDGSGGNGTLSDASAGGTTGSGISGGLIAGIVIAVIVGLCLVFLVLYKCCAKKNPKAGWAPAKYGKAIGANGGASKSNGYKGVGNELTSQSSDDRSDVQYFEGGSIAISFELLRQVTNNFGADNILGKGGFGVVYKGELHDGTRIAVKRMESNLMGTKGLKEFQAEIAVLTKVRHRHLVALLGFCTNGHERLLVYEYMSQGTLSQHLFEWKEHGSAPLTWMQRVTIALDVARGIEYLHSLAQQSFIHRDLKPSNILLADDMRAKVSDFGLVKNAPDGGKHSVETKLAGTFGYLAPEYAVTGRVTTKVDVYAFGVVLMELVTGRKALDETMPEDRSHLVTWFRRVLINKNDIRKSLDPTLDPDDEIYEVICKVAELAGHCTSREPSQRPDMGHAVNILGPLVEQWKPTHDELDDSFGIDFHLSLPQAVQRWQANEGTSTAADDYTHGRTISIGDTQTSQASILSGPSPLESGR